MEAWHLTKRFFGSLRQREPRPAEEEWLVAMLSPAEEKLYRRQAGIDRCHSVDCALAARERLGSHASLHAVVASALHDVGKADSSLGTFGRVVATVVGKAAPAGTIERWETGSGFRGEVARYVRHDVRGAELLMAAGSHPHVVGWAREHHEPPDRWSLDREVAEILLDADR